MKRLEIINYILRLIDAFFEGGMVRDSIPVPFVFALCPLFCSSGTFVETLHSMHRQPVEGLDEMEEVQGDG